MGRRRAGRRDRRLRDTCLAGEGTRRGQAACWECRAVGWIGARHRRQAGRQGGQRGGVTWRGRRAGWRGNDGFGRWRGLQGRQATLGGRRPRQDAEESPSVQSKRGQSSQDPSSARRVVQRSRARFQAGGQDQQRSASEPLILTFHGGRGSRRARRRHSPTSHPHRAMTATRALGMVAPACILGGLRVGVGTSRWSLSLEVFMVWRCPP